MTKSKIYALIGTILWGTLVALLLFFVVMPLPPSISNKDMGLVVSLGGDVDDYGFEKEITTTEEQPIPTMEEVKKADDDVEEREVITQKESSIVIPKKTEKKKVKKKQTYKVIKKENNALAQKETMSEKTQEETDKFLKNVFQHKGKKKKKEINIKVKKEEKKKTPIGEGNSNGHAWSLAGRELIGSISSPNYTRNVEGKITVAIRVDREGNVTNAYIGSPTTISDKATRDETIRSARKTHFSKGEEISLGKITYNFKLQ